MTDVVETVRRDVVVVDETTVEVIELLVQGPQGPPGSGGSGGGGAPSGPAGGVLAGTYPDPGFAVDMATQAELDAEQTARITADTILSTAVGQKQDAATAATDLAAEASARSSADSTLTAAAAAAQSTANAALPKAGGTMTGDIVLAGDPTANLHPATRQYVAAQVAALINGAPGALDTLKEIADQLSTDESAVAALSSSVTGKLTAASNLSDVVNAVTALANLGGVSSGDARLTNARTPTAHHTTHEPGGSDAMAVDAVAGTGSLRTLGTGAQQAAAGSDSRLSDQRTPVDGTVTDAKITAGGLSPSKVTGTAVITADSRLSDARTPTAHKTSHATGGSDALAPADIGAQAASARLAEIAALNTNSAVIEQVGGVWVARSMASLKTDLALVKGDVGLPNVDNTADTAKPVSTAQQTALDAILAVYRQVRAGATARGSTSAVAGTKYMLSIGSTADVVAPAANTSGAQQSVLIGIAAADYAVAGKTTKMRVKAHCSVATGPAVTITVGLYPVTGGASWSLGTVVAGSTVAFASPSSNTLTSGDSGDFTIPADGDYCLGYVVSGTPGAIFVLDGLLQVRNV